MPDNNHDEGGYDTVNVEAGDVPSWEEWYEAVERHIASGIMAWMMVGQPW